MNRLTFHIVAFCSFLFVNLNSQTFTSNPSIAIPDDKSTTCYDLTVSGIGTINTTTVLQNVCIDITHTWIDDIEATLVAPDGTSVELTTDNGSSGDNYTSTCFSMSASTSITSGSAPFTGSFIPEGNLNNVNNGQDADGTWQLCIRDDFTGDSGTLNSWSLTFGAAPPGPTPNEQDCDGAIPVCQTTYNQSNSFSGTGNIPGEIDPGPSCLNSGEKNDVWYIFTVQSSGNLNFSITPNSGSDDYDWAVYNISSANCSDIYSDASLEVSCNWSANVGNGGITGPNNGSLAQDEPAFAVSVGETYVINVSNYSSTQNGYNLDFGSSTAVIFDNIAPEIQSVSTPIACGATSLEFTFSENILCSTVDDTDFTLTGPGGSYTLSNVSGTNCNNGGNFENTFSADVSPAITTSGTYTISLDASTSGSVTDNCGNTAPSGSLDFSISGVTATISSSTNITCNGLANGSAQASGSNGTSPYTYLWDDGSSQNTATASSLSPGNYNVTVTDANGCSGVTSATITEPDPIVLTSSGNNETCPGASDGDVSVNISSGGTSPFAYSWDSSPIQSSSSASGLSGGTYTVTVTDNNGCAETTSETISAGTAIQADPSTGANQCLTGNTFSFTNNGTNSGVTYSWDFGDGSGTSTSASPNYTYSSAGTYSVSLTIDNGSCTDTETISIEVYEDPSSSISSINLTCNSVCDGSIDLTVSNGNAPYSYSWDNGAGSSEDPSSLCAGTYNITVTDVYGCTTTNSVVITEPSALSSSTTATDASCNGGNDGEISITVSGGSTPYSYSWDDGTNQTTNNPNNLEAGTYNVTITDSNGCTSTDSETVSDPNAISISSSNTNVDCNGNSSGAIDITVSGGSSPYSYSWSNSETSEDLSSIPAGSYTVTITDNNSCTETYTTTITESTSLSLNLTGTSPLCNGDNTGSISSSISGGTSPYTYAWDDVTNQTTTTAASLVSGSYTLTVTDNLGCTITTSETLIDPAAISLSLSLSNTSCNGVCDASLSSSASGGTGTLTYSWDNGAGSSPNASGLCAATTYTLTVTDDNGCSTSANETPSEPAIITLSTFGNDVSCNGLSDGNATVSASGGTPPYTYAWDDPSLQTVSTATSLSAGTYNVTVTDANGCTSNTSYTVGSPAAISLSGSSNNSTCGNNNGDATVVATGGNGVFSYLWDDGSAQTTSTAVNLTSGSYTVQVTDGNGCSESLIIAVSDAGGPTVSISSSTNVDCNGDNTGSATATVSGGASPYNYLWDDGSTQNTATATDLAAGSYSVTVTDNSGCTNSTSISITEPNALNSSISSSNLTCNGDISGAAIVTVTGGTSPYTYSWDDASSQTTATANNLNAGTYVITITDNSSCTASNSIIITEPSLISISSSNTNVDCFGDNTGAIDITASGGTSPYTYSWDNSQTSEDINNLSSGSYTLTVTDANGCTETSIQSITELSAITVSLTGNNPSCFGDNDGSISSSINGGTSPYSYSWDDISSQTTATANNLTAGSYTLTVTDNNGCTNSANQTISNPSTLSLVASSSDASCGQSNGDASVVVSGGSSPYTYLWNDGSVQTTATANNLGAGNFNVTVTDNNGCSSNSAVTVNSSSAGTANISSSTNINCNGDCDGSATASISGGTAPFTYQWDDPSSQTTATASNLCAGTFNVTITDAGGCSSTASVTITENTAISISVDAQNNPSCDGTSDGSVDISVSGGSSPYSFDWNGAYVSEDITSLGAGTYNLTVTDNNSCQESSSVILTEPTSILATVSSFNDVACFGGATGTIDVSISGGTSPYSYNWNDPSSQTTEDASSLSSGSYTLTVTDANGCNTTVNQAISEPADLTLSSSSTNPTCGNSNGDVSVSVSGGTNPYTYSWNDPSSQTTSSVNSLPAGSYSVIVTDANSCTNNTTIDITDSGSPTVNITSSNVNCNSNCDGFATANISSGDSPYTFSWDDPNTQTTATASNLCAGSYSVTVTDVNGCQTIENIVITEPDAISITLSSSGIDCALSCDGEITSSISGGASPYNYSWDDNNSQTTANASNLCSGSYMLTITDNNSCLASESFDISEPIFTATTISTTATCGNNDGSATVNVTSGNGPYSYSWNDPSNQTGLIATALSSGNYSVMVTDVNGCTITEAVSVSDTGGPSVTIDSQTNPTCFNDNDGSISISASGGNTPYTYSWNDSQNQSTATAINLSSGTYTVSVSDDNGCSNSEEITLSNPLEVNLSVSSISNETCYGQGNGSILLGASNGIGLYTYSWSDPSIGSSVLATNLSSGSYTATVFDSNGCSDQITATIDAPDEMSISITASNANCNSVCDGSLTATVDGGTTPYTYTWDDLNSQTTPTASSLCAGNYNVSVNDANGCSIISNGSIVAPGAIDVIADSQINESCTGSCDGILSISVTGGVSPYSYSWNDPLNSNGSSINNLCQGSYEVTITDNSGCSEVETFTISSGGALTASISKTDPSCFGQANGSASVSINGGMSPFTFLWNDPSLQSTQTASNLSSGSYEVTVTDANGCSNSASTILVDPTAINLSSSTVEANCGNNDGSATVTVSSGNAPFTYLWNDGATQTTSTASALSSGAYRVVVTDNNSCQDSLDITVNDASGPVIAIQNSTNALCNGQASGTATVQVNGGASPYNILWDDPNNQTGITASGLLAGNYSVSVTDNLGCTASTTVNITEPNTMVAAISSSSDASCFGVCDGAASILANSGTSPYSYTWTNGNTSSSANDLCAGNHQVIVSDANGCSVNLSVDINEPNQLVINTSSEDASCNLATGEASVSITNGSAPYLYSWDDSNNQSTATAVSLSEGNYYVTVTDSDGCTESGSIYVGNNNNESLTISSISHETCYGLSDGSASISVSGMETPITYSWDDSANTTSASISNLSGGSYTVTVTDGNGCILNETITINAATQINVSASLSHPSCFGNCDGFISTSISGGISPYSYQWDDPSNSTVSSISNLCHGTYDLTVTDANGCEETISESLTQPSEITIVSTGSNANCGNSDGSITSTASNGSTPYTYQWNDPFNQTNATATGLFAGSYIVIVTDANGCTGSDTVQIVDIAGTSAVIQSVRDVTCFGLADGYIEAIAVGGSGPFTYSWDDPNNQNTNVATNLDVGTYNVVITDEKGCTSSAYAVITEPDTLYTSTSSTPTSCLGSTDGTASALVYGGSGPFSYIWSDDLGQTSLNATDLASGSYSIIVTDANGCNAISSITVDSPQAIGGNITTYETSCLESCDGSLKLNATGGDGNYTYLWSDPSSQSLDSISGLCPGSFSVEITDGKGCTETLIGTISSPDALVASLEMKANPSCFGECNGYIEVATQGGTSPYSYSWNDSFNQSTQGANNLCSGTYSVNVTDANGCFTAFTETVTEPEELALATNATSTSCNGTCDGQATVVSSGGTAPFTYLWDDASLQQSQTALNLCAGIVRVQVRDANQCIAFDSTEVEEPNAITVSSSSTPSNCGGNNGTATVTVSGGTLPYAYQWNDNNNQITSTAVNLFAAGYLVSITDGNGCIYEEQVNISDIASPLVSLTSITHNECANAGNGSIEVNITGGVPGYSIVWDDPNAQTTSTASNLNGGNYTITVTDAAGCKAIFSQTILEPLDMAAAISDFSFPSCFGFNDGFARATAGGGTPPYTFQWNDILNQSGIVANSLSAGTYRVTATDINGCSNFTEVTLNEPERLRMTYDIYNVDCYGGTTGRVDVHLTGGTPGYYYNWTPSGNSGSSATNLNTGIHTVSIYDGNSCAISQSFLITEPDEMIVTSASFPTTCSLNNGSIQINTSGGTPPYTYNWNPNVTTASDANGLAPMDYQIVIEDNNGCQQSRLETVYETPSPEIERLIPVNTTCSGTNDGQLTVDIKEAEAPYTLLWSPFGGDQETLSNLSAGVYSVTLTDRNGCKVSAGGVVESPEPVRILTNGNDLICYGETINISGVAVGGNGDFTYTWTPTLDGNPNQSVSPITSTRYSVMATDILGCQSDTRNIIVEVSSPLEIEISSVPELCLGDSINLESSLIGGNGGPYYYNWEVLNDSSSMINVKPSTSTWYYLNASDSCSIDVRDSIEVIVNPIPTLFLNSDITEGCQPLIVNFDLNTDIGTSYSWEFGNGNFSSLEMPEEEYLDTGYYNVSLTVMSDAGCSASIVDSNLIKVNPLPIAGFELFPKNTNTIAPNVYFADSSQGASTYLYNFGNIYADINESTLSSPVQPYNLPGEYEVSQTVTNEFGCTDTHVDTVNVAEGFVVYFPDVFSPNGDGINDGWKPLGTGVVNDGYDLTVFNRWGELLFHSTDYNEYWLGQFQGRSDKISQIGVYAYKLRLTDGNGEEHFFYGNVSIVR